MATDVRRLPMFPLGGVLFPSAVLPLHVFEPRYRVLVTDCLAGDAKFGVTLIERGSEVGGNDVRTDVGTVAHIIDATELSDGRWALSAVGTHRIRILTWLPDDPYPQAEVQDWPDLDPDPSGDLTDVYRERVQILRRVLALKAELREGAARATTEMSDDPNLGSYQLAALAPFGPLDQQRLLAAEGVGQRLELVGQLLHEEATFLEQRLDMG
jgi:Lon protease-like protein